MNVTSATASGSGSHQVQAEGVFVDSSQVEAAWPDLSNELTGLGVPSEDLEELHTALLSDGNPVNGELGPATQNWIGRFSAKVATGAIAVGQPASVEVVSHTILKAFGLG